jgi:hypothetical protein
MKDKAIRFDVTIAAFALVISAIASAASVYQTHVIAQQFSATVWPYLSFEVSRDSIHLAVSMRNDGLGPALIRSVSYTEDGKPVPSLNAIVDPMVAKLKSPPSQKIRTSVSTIGPGDVLPANQSITLVQADGAPIVQALLAAASHVNMTVCYCSLLGRCWIKQFDEPTGTPHDVSACPIS